MKIPLPTIMRHWRAREFEAHTAPKAMHFGLSVWAFAARRPALYRFASRALARFLNLLGGRKRAVHSLPLLRGWFAVRDFPAPEGRTFLEQWRSP